MKQKKNRILDEISSDQFDEFMRHVIINTTDLNLKNKLENEYRKQKLTQRFALLGINSATRMDWSGFDERIPIWSGEQKFYKLADFIFNVENYDINSDINCHLFRSKVSSEPYLIEVETGH